MSHYTVIKYVPNPLTDECINVGVIAFDGNQVIAQLTSDFSRARAFAKTDPKLLRATLSDFRQLIEQNALNEFKIRRICDSWQNEVQFTTPRVSALPVDQLLSEVVPQFLPSQNREASVQRVGKRRAVKVAVELLTGRITDRFHTTKAVARKLIRLDYEAPGRLEQHEFDLALVNGELKLAAIALSFARENKAQLKRDLDAAAFVMEDMRKMNRRLPLVVLGYRADSAPEDIRRAETLFANWDAKVITETKVDAWAGTVVQALPANVIH